MNLAQSIKTVSELKGQFTLRSGMVSNTYFDKYQFESDPKLLKQIAEAMSVLIPSNTDILCGLEMGGIPIVTMLSQISGLPSAFIRKAAKNYGTCRYAEGPNLANRQLLIVEDVVSSGGAIIEAASKMKADGLCVESAICVSLMSALSCLKSILCSALEVNILYGSSVPLVTRSSIKTPM